MSVYYDRYKDFRVNGEIKPLPFIKIEALDTDKTFVYRVGQTRLDKLSDKYYNNPYHGFLIMSANSQFGGLEFNIPDNEIIRIPFPFKSALERYENAVKLYKQLYGNE